MTSDWKKLISKALEKMTETQLAKEMGVSQPTVNAWKKGLGKPKGWQLEAATIKLKTIIIGVDPGDKSVKDTPGFQEVENKQDIPIIGMATAGEAHDFSGIAYSWQESISVNIPTRIKAVAIEIVGDSMEPRYYAGQLAIVIDDQRPVNGDLVVANIKKMGPVFKKFHCNGDPLNTIMTLTSFNPLYEPIKLHEKDFYWIVPVVEVRDVRRKF